LHHILLASRMVWALIPVCPILFVLVMPSVRPPTWLECDKGEWLFNATVVILVITVPVGYYARGQTYKRYWQGDRITAAGYVGGNLILWVGCGGVGLTGLAAILACGSYWPAIVPISVAAAVHIVNFPHGKPMQRAKPNFHHS